MKNQRGVGVLRFLNCMTQGLPALLERVGFREQTDWLARVQRSIIITSPNQFIFDDFCTMKVVISQHRTLTQLMSERMGTM